MKAKVTFCFLGALFIASTGFSQVDTLITNNQRIPCVVKGVSEVAVTFIYPGEEVTNTVFKNAVQKIVFKNGRVQTFAESTSFKKVTSVYDYDNVTMTAIFPEVQGLFKLGDVSSKARGTTELSNQNRVKERAYRKLKIDAAMMGGNIIYMTNQYSEGNQMGSKYQSGHSAATSLTGVVYSNQLPSFDDFISKVQDDREFQVIEQNSLWSGGSDLKIANIMRTLHIGKITNENGLIIMDGQMSDIPTKYHKFRVVSYNDEYFWIFYQDINTAYNLRVRY